MGNVDYSANARVYVLPSSRTGGRHVLKEKLGLTERRVINAGARLGNAIAASGLCLPAEVVVTPERVILSCGKAFKHVLDVTERGLAADISAIAKEGTIRYVCVRRIDGFPFTYVSYGRRDSAEFTASVYARRRKPRKEGGT